MATFAPAYFEYMASTISAGVSLSSWAWTFLVADKMLASYTSRKDLWVLPHQSTRCETWSEE